MAKELGPNTELEIVAPHSANFIRSVNSALVKQLKATDQGTLEIPTLLSRAKSLVFRKSYIAILTTKEESSDA